MTDAPTPKAPPTPGPLYEPLSALVEAHEHFVAHRVGMDVGVFKPSPETRQRDLKLWLAVCDAATAARSALAAAASGQGE